MAFARTGEGICVPSMSFFSTIGSAVPLAMFLVNGDLGPKLKCSLFTILGLIVGLEYQKYLLSINNK